MANPQKENGYTPIANEIVEALARTRINGEAMQVLWVIIRKTYGFNKKEDSISLSQFVEVTGLPKPTVCKALNKLKRLGIITQKANAVANKYCLIKNYALWKPLPKKPTLPKKEIIITQKAKKYYPKSHIQKTVTKDTITKDIQTSDEIAQFIHLFKEINPTIGKDYGRPPQRAASERLLKLHPLDYWERFMIAYAAKLSDRFCPRATTPIQLEEKLGDIIAYGRASREIKNKVKLI